MIPKLQQWLPIVDNQGRLSNEGLKAFNDAFQSIFTTLDQIIQLFNITDQLGTDVGTAQASADAAQSTADGAVADAASAQSTANTAVASAASAQATANAAAPQTRSITAGAGLTGGGNLTTDRSFDIGAGAGITVNANDIALTVPTAHGTYTPTLTNISNLDAVTAFACQWQQVGDCVTVSGRIDVDPTALSASTVVDINLPVPTNNFTADGQLGGTAAMGGVQQSARIAALVGGQVARLSFLSTDTSNRPMSFCFMYRIV